MTRKAVNDDILLISEDNWLTYFRSLHSKSPLNPIQQSIINDLKLLEHHKEVFPSLDYLFTENEIFISAKRLQNNKSAFSDKIKNEMIKASLKKMILEYLVSRSYCTNNNYINQKEEMNHQTTEEFVSQAVWESCFVLF